MSKWMLLSKKTGQLGNRLTVYAHCLAAARARGYRFLNPAFCDYAPYFVGPQSTLASADRLPSPGAGQPSHGASRTTEHPAFPILLMRAPAAARARRDWRAVARR